MRKQDHITIMPLESHWHAHHSKMDTMLSPRAPADVKERAYVPFRTILNKSWTQFTRLYNSDTRVTPNASHYYRMPTSIANLIVFPENEAFLTA